MTTRVLLGIALLSLMIGCSKGPPLAAPVDPDKARTSLRMTLDAWKAGKPIDAMEKESPPITAQDFDWMAGAKLTDYKVLGDGKAEDANLRVPVQLMIRDSQGRAATKTVNYIVGTDPKITVFRAFE